MRVSQLDEEAVQHLFTKSDLTKMHFSYDIKGFKNELKHWFAKVFYGIQTHKYLGSWVKVTLSYYVVDNEGFFIGSSNYWYD